MKNPPTETENENERRRWLYDRGIIQFYARTASWSRHVDSTAPHALPHSRRCQRAGGREEGGAYRAGVEKRSEFRGRRPSLAAGGCHQFTTVVRGLNAAVGRSGPQPANLPSSRGGSSFFGHTAFLRRLFAKPTSPHGAIQSESLTRKHMRTELFWELVFHARLEQKGEFPPCVRHPTSPIGFFVLE